MTDHKQRTLAELQRAAQEQSDYHEVHVGTLILWGVVVLMGLFLVADIAWRFHTGHGFLDY